MNSYHVIYYILFLLWILYVYSIGIFIKYLNLDIFHIHLFLTITSFYGFFISSIFILFDSDARIIINQIYNLDRSNKIKILLSCLPINKIIIIAYIDLDPIIIQLLGSLGIAFNYISSALYNRQLYLFNSIINLSLLINIISCIFPFIFNDNFGIKINNTVQIGPIGLTISILYIILNGLSNLIGANIKFIENITSDSNTFIQMTFLLIEVISYIILIPFMYYFQIYVIREEIIINIELLKLIFIYGTLLSLLYGPFYILVTRYYLKLSAVDIGILRNLGLIIIIFISCIFNISVFYYLYIPAIILIIISSMIIIYKKNKLMIQHNETKTILPNHNIISIINKE